MARRTISFLRLESLWPQAGAGRSPIRLTRRQATFTWLTIAGVGVLFLLGGVLGAGRIVSGLGSLVIAGAATWGVSARAGGRPVVFTALAFVLGLIVLISDNGPLRTGAAVMTGAMAATFAVMITVPATTTLHAIRETLTATAISVAGAVAVVGWQPVVRIARFEYAVLVITLVGVFWMVYRLGSGLHGLGRRGVLAVGIGLFMLALTLLYAELLRRYGSDGVVKQLSDGVTWMRHHLGGYPRPIETLLGIPALVWGTQMRSRRRHGWWVCAFGAGLTAPVASTLINTDLGVLTDLVSLVYGLIVGSVIGAVLIRIDLLLTGTSRGTRAAGRRVAFDIDRSAVGEEPLRTQSLL